MNKMNWKWTLVCAATLVAATVLLDAQAWAGKPGGGTPPPPSSPPVRYKAVSLGTERVVLYDMNNCGAIVGAFYNTPRAYLAIVDATTGTAVISDLNTFNSPWVDLQPGAPPAIGWQATRAAGINDAGWIAGMGRIDATGLTRAFLYAPDKQTGVWTFYLLPQVPDLALGMAASDVNNFGEVVGRRYLDNDSLFTWNANSGIRNLGFASGNPAVSDTGIMICNNSPFLSNRNLLRYDFNSNTSNTIIGISSYSGCLNCFGIIAGERTTGGKIGNVEIVRFSQPSLADVKVIEGGDALKEAQAINDAGDVLYRKRVIVKNTAVYSLWFYRDGLPSTLNIGSLVDPPINDYLSAERHAEMSDANSTTDPQGTGFGLIAVDGTQPLVLIPQKP